MKEKILCIEDDLTTQTTIKFSLDNYSVIIANNLHDAECAITKGGFIAAIFDVQLPDGNSLNFFSQSKKNTNLKNIPIIFISESDDISQKLLAFSIGADDFITKPFNPLELNARITSKIIKFTKSTTERNTRLLGDIEIDLDRQKISQIINGDETDLLLTAIEQKILIFLSSRIEQVFSRDQILNNVWSNAHITDRTVDSHIAHLRNKIKSSLVMINTVKNFGYKITIK
jgi:two-component system phosphate regulon response regulator PhoB